MVSQSARHSLSTSAPSGSSDTPDTSGPASTRWASSGPSSAISTNPLITPGMSLRRSHRLTCTTSRGIVGRRVTVEHEARVVSHCSLRSVATVVHDRTLPVGPRRQTDGPEDRADRSRIQTPVLGRERVDRRRDDDQSVAVDPTRRVDLPREHEGIGAFEVGPEEGPRLVGLVVAGVTPDMASPDDTHTGGTEPVDHSRGLGVVEQHDVTGIDQRQHLGRVGAQIPFVRDVLGRPDRAAVAPRTVQEVVQSLRDGEELGRRHPVRASGSRSAHPSRRREASGASRPRHRRATSRSRARSCGRRTPPAPAPRRPQGDGRVQASGCS